MQFLLINICQFKNYFYIWSKSTPQTPQLWPYTLTKPQTLRLAEKFGKATPQLQTK